MERNEYGRKMMAILKETSDKQSEEATRHSSALGNILREERVAIDSLNKQFLDEGGNPRDVRNYKR